MAKNKIDKTEDGFEAFESSISRTEQFIEKNQKYLTIGLVVILAVVGIVMAYNKWYKLPLEEKSQNQMYVAQQYFETDSFNLALNGDGEFLGFADIIKKYGSTGAGNVANYYAGISCMKLKKYDEAIKYLDDFSSSDMMLKPIALGNIGDAYSEKGENDKAAKYYKKAANASDNDFTAPLYLMKLGNALESKNDWKGALEAYKTVKTKYKKSQEARDIDKFITRAKLKM